jgi:GDPmannose 4,6-dehydratase
MTKTDNIIITGITGQDGIFLTSLLLEKTDANIFGITRSKNNAEFIKIIQKLRPVAERRINLVNLNLLEKSSVKQFIRDTKPAAIFNLSGPSSVYNSITNPELAIEIETIFDNLTSSIIELNNFPFFFQASSSEMYGTNTNTFLDEESEMSPQSPYAESKLKNHLKIKDFFKDFNWKIVSGIMFNHDSEYRKNDFLIPKIINTALNLHQLDKKELIIGSLNLTRDWTHAKDISKGIFALYSSLDSLDWAYVLGRGSGNSIKDILLEVSKLTDVNLLEITKINEKLLREGDPLIRISNPIRIEEATGWSVEISFDNMIKKIIRNM